MATKRKDGRWQASLLTNGKRIYVYAETEELAEKLKRQRELEINPEPLVDGTLSHFVESAWWPRVAAGTKRGSQRRYRDCFGKHIEPDLGNLQLPAITYEVLIEFMNRRAFSRPTGRMVQGILGNILQFAWQLQKIDRNPVKLLPTIRKARKPKKNLTADMVNKILDIAKGTRMEGPCWAASHIALRRGEIAALKVSSFIDETTSIELSKTRDKWEEGALKGKQDGETRIIPLTPALYAKLKSFCQPDQIYVFTDVDQHTKQVRPIHPDRISKSMDDLCDLAGVERIDFHDLRAAAASNLRRSGVPMDMIRQILGHSSLATTVVYMDESEADMREALGKLSSTYGVSAEI